MIFDEEEDEVYEYRDRRYCKHTGQPHTTAILLWDDRWILRVTGRMDNVDYLLATESRDDWFVATLEAEAVLVAEGLPLTVEVQCD